MWRLSDGGIHFSMLNMYVLLQGSPGKLRHSCRLDAQGMQRTSQHPKGEGRLLGKVHPSQHTLFSEVMSVCSDPTSLCSSQGSLG